MIRSIRRLPWGRNHTADILDSIDTIRKSVRMSNPVDSLKPLLQRLITLAEAHDERLARLEAANSRLGAQIARLGEQMTRQIEPAPRVEEAAAAAPPRASGPVNNGRFGEHAGHLNEQLTRTREQLGRIAEHLARLERASEGLRDEVAQQGEDHLHLLEKLQSSLTEVQERLPLQVQRRFEEVLGIESDDTESDGAAKSEIGAVQEEIRQLGKHMADLSSQLGRITRSAAEPPKPETKPAAGKAGAKPAAASAKPVGRRFAVR